MRKKIISLLTVGILTISIFTIAPVMASAAITKAALRIDVVPDPALNAVIRAQLNASSSDDQIDILVSEEISPAHVASLTGTLQAASSGIVNLEGLQYATSLTGLGLYNNQISVITPLANLTNLTTLELNTNQISDISSLENLTNLSTLYLEANQISDISSLTRLTKLTTLNADDNQISDISSLEDLVNLTSLSLFNNQVSDISTLTGLTKLTTLYLDVNQISDVSPLSTLTNLTALGLGDNQISNISYLSTLTNLTQLHLYDNQIVNVSPLSTLNKLVVLNLRNNHVLDISPLSTIKDSSSLIIVDGQTATTPTAINNSGTVTIPNPCVNADGSLVNLNDAGNNLNGGTYNPTAQTLTWTGLPLDVAGNLIFNFTTPIVGTSAGNFIGTVTIPYGKAAAAPITVKYWDEAGATIAPNSVLPAGEVGNPYTAPPALQKTIPGYTFKEVKQGTGYVPTTGIYTDNQQTIVYIYKKKPPLPVIPPTANPNSGDGSPIALFIFAGTMLSVCAVLLKKRKVK